MKKYLILITILFCNIQIAHADYASAFKLAQEKKLAEHPYWLRLLHYRRNIFGLRRSDVDDKKFFLSPRGRKDPSAELEATLLQIYTSGEEALACRYPARYHWLASQLKLDEELSKPQCDRFNSWKAKLNPETVSLVFSSYYLNNPASMYGHTFMKLGRKGYRENTNLLDYTVNYAADADTNNGVQFAVKGLFGGYRGRFSTTPYYIQVQKYTNMESRDLWEYELNLNQEKIDQMVRHLWEMGHTSMAYYFLNKNCSYQLLPLLEVADPNLSFIYDYWLRAIPLDTLRSVLAENNLVKAIHIRPSHIRTMLQQRDRLTDIEQDRAKKIILKKGETNLDEFPDERKAFILDAALSYQKYKYGFYRDQPDEVKNKERDLLLMRNDLKVEKNKKFDFSGVPHPEEGHGSARVGLGIGSSDGKSFQELSYRGAIHDLEARQVGFVEGSQLEMFNFRFRHQDDTNRINIEELLLLEILSLSSWDNWVHPPSWHVRTGLEVAHDLDKKPESSLTYGLKGGSGYSLTVPYVKQGLLYALWQSDISLGSVFDDGYRLGGGGRAGFVGNLTSFWRMHATASVLRYPAGHIGNVVKFQLTQSFFLSKNIEARLDLERQNAYKEILLNTFFYF